MKKELTKEQQAIIDSDKKNLIVSASAGSGKTFVVIEYLTKLVSEKKIPLSKVLVLTFTKAAAGEMRARLTKAILECEKSDFLTEQLDEISLADISTIHAFCEKLLKRYSSLISLPQNFVVLEEKQSFALKNRAFNDAFETLSRQNEKSFETFYLAFKKNKDLMLSSLESFASFLESQKEGDALADEFEEKYQYFFNEAEDYLNAHLKAELEKCRRVFSSINIFDMEEAYQKYGENLKNLCNISLEESFVLNAKKIGSFDMGRMPSNKTAFPYEKECLSRVKETLSSLISLVQPYLIYSETFEKEEKDNQVVQALVRLYKEYRKNYSQLKSYRNALDFSDLEQYAKKLLENKEILYDLQDRYQYIFIDEYQDTNPLQENFVKKVAEGGRFIGVGDPKQGIYGFRNATMEIMQKDIQNFKREKDSDALFLNGNFRSNNEILQFVNTVFEKHMTIESVGIDYAKTSRLEGHTEFKDDGFKGVEVDIIIPQKEEIEPRKGVYSVKNDELGYEDKNLLEVMTIASHIEKYLAGRIYDGKKKEFRNVEEGDIVILFRKRSALMLRLASYLETMGHNVIADCSNSLIENGEIASIVSFISLALSYEDEISLASAMASAIGGFSPEELVEFKGDREMSFKDRVFASQNQKVIDFLKKVEDFKCDTIIRGLNEGLKKLLNDNCYYLYLNSLENSSETKIALNNLFKLINSGYDFNLQGLIDYLQSGKSQNKGEGSENAITLTTIHATKGLEYPIVILAGCGDSMGKADISVINFSKKFGLGTNLYDLEENCLVPSMAKIANKIYNQKREYIDELMIFYVALTRAQNHLVLTGALSKDGLKKLYQNKNYLALVLNSFGENFGEDVVERGCIEGENVVFNFIDDIEEEPILLQEKLTEKENDFEKAEEGLKEYIDFVYPNKSADRRFKNSVTSLMEDKHEFLNMGEKSDLTRNDAIIRGNAYHEALKILPFEKINSLQDIDALLTEDSLSEGYYQEIDKALLLKNILLIKGVLKGQRAIKEREFISSCSLKELGIMDSEERVIVQGIIDLFSLGEKNILIDYKFSSIEDENVLKAKYFRQIELYEKALEKAFGKKLDEKYLLSLKNGKLIKF